MNNELYHHGILGQKWGVRRYQNPDGTRTAAGKKRYSDDSEKSEKRKEVAKKVGTGLAIAGSVAGAAGAAYVGYKNKGNDAFTENIKGGKDKPNVSPVEKTLKESGNALNKSSDLVGHVKALNKTEHKEDLSGFSNKELQEAITRMNLEKQYRTLTQEDTATGYETAQHILGIAGSVVGIAAAAATIYGTLKK